MVKNKKKNPLHMFHIKKWHLYGMLADQRTHENLKLILQWRSTNSIA